MPMTSKEMIRFLRKNGFIEMKNGPTGQNYIIPLLRKPRLFLVTMSLEKAKNKPFSSRQG